MTNDSLTQIIHNKWFIKRIDSRQMMTH